jgi:hypothetical protein
MGRAGVSECVSKFRSGVVPVENAECWGPPLMSTPDENVNRLKEMVFENIEITKCEDAYMLGISFVSV